MLVLEVRTCGRLISLLAAEDIPSTPLPSPDTVSQRIRGGSCHRIVGGSGWQHEDLNLNSSCSVRGCAWALSEQHTWPQANGCTPDRTLGSSGWSLSRQSHFQLATVAMEGSESRVRDNSSRTVAGQSSGSTTRKSSSIRMRSCSNPQIDCRTCQVIEALFLQDAGCGKQDAACSMRRAIESIWGLWLGFVAAD